MIFSFTKARRRSSWVGGLKSLQQSGWASKMMIPGLRGLTEAKAFTNEYVIEWSPPRKTGIPCSGFFSKCSWAYEKMFSFVFKKS